MEEQQKELDDKWLQEGVQRMMVMLESDSRNESFARVCVASFMTRMNPTVAETDDVKTAVSEAVTNSIVHGYPYEKGLIRLVCAIEKDTLTVQIRDWGRGIENVKKGDGANVQPICTRNRTFWNGVLLHGSIYG